MEIKVYGIAGNRLTGQIQYYLEKSDGYVDGEQRKVPVYRTGLEKKVGYYASLRQDSTVSWSFKSGDGPVNIYAFSNRLDVIERRLHDLIEYPYSCNEQLASKLKALVLYQRHVQKEAHPQTSKKIKRIIRQLRDHQNEQGLWGWWNINRTEMWVSRHVLEALVMARNAGYLVQLDFAKITEEAVWDLGSIRSVSEKINWLYIASILGLEIDRSRYIRDLDASEKPNLEDRLRWARVKQLNGLSDSLAWLDTHVFRDPLGRSYLDDEEKEEGFSDRKLKLTTLALSLYTYDSTFQESAEKLGLLDYLIDQVAQEGYLNTYTASNAIDALLTSGEVGLEDALKLSYSSGEQAKTIETFPYQDVIEEPEELTFRLEGSGKVYLTAYQQVWQDKSTQDNTYFKIERAFDGAATTLEAGKPILLKAEVEVRSDAEYVMVEIPIPAGCSYNTKERGGKEVHREYFKEKVSLFCRKLSRGTHTFEVDLLPRYGGKFQVNPAKVELMYYPVHSANDELMRVRISD